MIQRVQTIFLLLPVLCFPALLWVPFMTVGDAKAVTLSGYMLGMILQTLISVLALITVFLYSRRPLQIRLGWLGFVISLVFSILLVTLPYLLQGEEVVTGDHHTTAGTWLSFLNAVGFLLAVRFIKRDEDLVRSMDRIR